MKSLGYAMLFSGYIERSECPFIGHALMQLPVWRLLEFLKRAVVVHPDNKAIMRLYAIICKALATLFDNIVGSVDLSFLRTVRPPTKLSTEQSEESDVQYNNFYCGINGKNLEENIGAVSAGYCGPLRLPLRFQLSEHP